jgi:hypothetical protein
MRRNEAPPPAWIEWLGWSLFAAFWGLFMLAISDFERTGDFLIAVVIWCFHHPLATFIIVMAILMFFTTPPEAWAELRKPLPKPDKEGDK